MPAKVDRCVKELLPRLKQEYRDKYGKEPSADRLDELERQAWAICNKSVGEGGGDEDA